MIIYLSIQTLFTLTNFLKRCPQQLLIRFSIFSFFFCTDCHVTITNYSKYKSQDALYSKQQILTAFQWNTVKKLYCSIVIVSMTNSHLFLWNMMRIGRSVPSSRNSIPNSSFVVGLEPARQKRTDNFKIIEGIWCLSKYVCTSYHLQPSLN